MATINDIAKIAGVSTTTVSHVVNKTRYVSPELAQRVHDAIKSLDSPPNFILKKGNYLSNSIIPQYIILLISDKDSYFQRETAAAIETQMENSEFSLITLEYGNDHKRLDIISSFLLSTPQAAGIIAFPDDEGIIFEKVLKQSNLPIVILGRNTDIIHADTIISDNFDGAYKATKHLIKSGHEHIAFISSAFEDTSDRINGYKRALEENNITFLPGYLRTSHCSYNEIFETLDKLMDSPTVPTAIFAANYSVVLPLFQYIESHNIICPNDLSIVAFNDFDWAKLHNPPVTSVMQNAHEISKKALECLNDRLGGNTKNFKSIIIPTKLKVRGSTCGIGRGPFGEKAESLDSLILSESEIELLKEKGYTAAISFHYAGASWMNLHQKGIKDIFDTLGISLIAITDAHFDPKLQCKQLQSLQILEPDILIAIPTDNTRTSEAFKKITSSQTKLILITNIPEGLTQKDYVACVSVNEHSHGRFIGQGLGEYMLRHNLKNIGLIKYGANFYATNQRDNAAEQILAEEYPELNICATAHFDNEEDVYKKTHELIKHHPEIEGLYISWEGPALKAIAALTELNRTDIAISTADLDHASALNMAKGGMIKSLSAQCPYEQGQAMALAASNALLGKKTPSFIGIEPLSVTPDNLLKSWKKVFKDEPGHELKRAFKENPNYIS